MKKRLRQDLMNILPKETLDNVNNSYDIIGDIAVTRVIKIPKRHWTKISKTIMKTHRNVKTVLAQTEPVKGEFRTRKLTYVAGRNKATTIHAEHACRFSIDLRKCYFSPRLSTERLRIAEQVKPNETIINMFSGVGCFSLIIAAHSKASKIYSIDVNPDALTFMHRNARLNKAYGKVIPILGDAKEIIQRNLVEKADRILMPLPGKALNYLPYALQGLKNHHGIIHFYDFVHATKKEDPISKVKGRTARRLRNLGIKFEFPLGRVVRTTGPNWYQVVLDIIV